jgi:surface protein
MFQGASSFNQNIGGWNTSAVTEMGRMFSGASAFNQDISSWDVSTVNSGNMYEMFKDATSFDQDLSSWNVLNIPSEPNDFATGATLVTSDEHPVWGTDGTVPVGAPEYDITTAALWTFSNPLPAGNNEFGKQLSSYGEYTVISDPSFDVANINVNSNDGRVYVRRQTAQGSQASHTINNPNLDGNSVNNDAFGKRVHQTLNYITINTGENNNAGGGVRVMNAVTGAVVLDISEPTIPSYGYSQGMSHLGSFVDPSETKLIVPNSQYDDGTNYGAMEIWDLLAGTKTTEILNPNTDGRDETNSYYNKDLFAGTYAGITDYLYVSAKGEDIAFGQSNVGIIYQYDYSGNLITSLPSPVTTDNFGFGTIMFASDNWLLVGTSTQDRFYVYSISGSTLTFDRVWTDASFASLGQNGGIDNNRFSVSTGSAIKVFDIASGTEIVSVAIAGYPKWGTVSNGRLVVVSNDIVSLYGS